MKKQYFYCDIEFEFIKKKSKKKLAQEALEWLGPTIDEFDYTPCCIELDSDVYRLHLHFKDESIGELATFVDNIYETAKNCKEENVYPAENLKITSIHIARGRGGIDLPVWFS
jgi:hypothetical protein